jgi:hypothetical protein
MDHDNLETSTMIDMPEYVMVLLHFFKGRRIRKSHPVMIDLPAD